MKVSFVIPCYRSADCIEDVCDSIKKVMCENDLDYEIILVNDSSPDATLKSIMRICSENSNVKGLNLAKNFGQHSALMAGFHYVSGDIIICLDDDGQIDPVESIRLIQKLDEGYDAVYASYNNKQHSFLRNIGSKLNDYMAYKLINKPKNLRVSSYFAARRFVIDKIIEYSNPYPYVIGLILRTTSKIANVPITHKKRAYGTSGYSFIKLISLWMNGSTAFSIKPLRIATFLGISTSILGFAYALYIIINRILYTDYVMGWSSLMSAILILGGLMLFTLGILGEYIGRIYIGLNNSPQYVIKDTLNINDTNEMR